MICEVFHCVNWPFKFVTVLDECINSFETLQYTYNGEVHDFEYPDSEGKVNDDDDHEK